VSEAPILAADGVRKQFGALVVLDGVALEVGSGHALGIVGPNGAGAAEAGPFGYPCDEGGGLHLYEEERVCELIEPGGEEPVGDGEVGELVVTALGRSGFPVVRYRTGDVVCATTERCPAGHPGRWLPDGIPGRVDDMVVVRGMNVFPSAIEQILRESTDLGEFRITFYTDPHAMDEVKVEAELARPATRAGYRRGCASASACGCGSCRSSRASCPPTRTRRGAWRTSGRAASRREA